VLVAATLVAFWRVRPLAGGLLVPYLLWVGFAAALNWSVWQLNPRWLGSPKPAFPLVWSARSSGSLSGRAVRDSVDPRRLPASRRHRDPADRG
jgi:hypothetical protein